MRNLFRFISLRQLQSKPGRTLLTTLGVALGLSLWVAIQSINNSTLHSFRESFESLAGKAQLTISAGEAGFDESLADTLKDLKEIKHIVPMVLTRGHFAGDKDAKRTLMILGVDLLKEQNVRTYKVSDEEVIEDPLMFLNQPDSIILTKSFAKEHKLKIDDQFDLATADGKKRFTVRGLLTPEGPAKAYGGAIALMDIDGAKMTFGKGNRVDRMDLVIDENINIEFIQNKIQSIIGDGFVVQRPSGQSEEMERMIKSFQTMLEFFSTLALFVGLFMVTNSIGISVAERRKEIGTLRALGSNRNKILILFILEAMIIGIIGSIFGSAGGYALAKYLVTDVTKSISGQFVIHMQVPEIIFGAREIFLAILIGTSSSICAALYPSYFATKIGPLEAIKKSSDSEQSRLFILQKWMPLFGLVLLGFTAVYAASKNAPDSILFQKLNLLFTLVGAACISPTLVFFLLHLLGRIQNKKEEIHSNIISRLSTENLIRNKKRTSSNISILMIGLCFVIIVSAVNVSFKKSLTNWLDRALTADLLVSSYGNIMGVDVQPISEDIGWELQKIKGIQVTPNLPTYSQRYLRFRYQGEQIAIKAMDYLDTSIRYSNLLTIDRNPYEAGMELYHGKEPALIVSMNFAKTFHTKIGDFIELKTPTGNFKLKIVATIVDFSNPKGVIYLKRELYKEYFKDPLVNFFGLHFEKGFESAESRTAVINEIDAKLGQKFNLMITSNAEIKKQMLDKVDQSFGFMRAVEVAALTVALLGILNTLLVSVMERTREIGLMRAVGMEQKQVFSLIMRESFFQGLLGSLVAIMLGSWISYSWLTKSLSAVLGWIVDYHYPWASIASTISLGVIVALIAGFIPSRKAATLDIKEALEYE